MVTMAGAMGDYLDCNIFCLNRGYIPGFCGSHLRPVYYPISEVT